jgi:hypothetical protein
MNTQPDTARCTQLRKLHTGLSHEVKLLKESIKKAEREGVDTAVESLQHLKHLQASLNTISLELEKCPADSSEVAAALQPVKTIRDESQWFPESQEEPSDDDFENVVDEP